MAPAEDIEIVIGGQAENNEAKSDAALRAIRDKWREILELEPDSDVEEVDIVVSIFHTMHIIFIY